MCKSCFLTILAIFHIYIVPVKAIRQIRDVLRDVYRTASVGKKEVLL